MSANVPEWGWNGQRHAHLVILCHHAKVYNHLWSYNALSENKADLLLECLGSLYFVTGEFDALLPWPFQQRVTLTIIDQAETGESDVIQVLQPDSALSSFKQPKKATNLGCGYAKFMSQEDLYKPDRRMSAKITWL